MFLRRLRIVALALLASGALLAAARASTTAPTARELDIKRRIKAEERRMLLEEGKLHIREARAERAARRANKTPAGGYRSERAPIIVDGAPGGPAMPQAPRLAPPRFGTSSVSIGLNSLVNDTTGDRLTTSFAGEDEPGVAMLGRYVVITYNEGKGFLDETGAANLIGYSYSTDGGLTFTSPAVMPKPTNFHWSSDPVVTVNQKTGEFFFCGLMENTSQNGVAVMRGTFTSNVLNWDAPKVVRQVSSVSFFIDKPWVVADSSSGRLYITYTQFDVNGDNIMFQRTSGNPNTWLTPIQMNDPGASGTVQGSRPAVGPNGEVYVVWKEIGPVDADFLRISKSTNQGASFNTPRLASAIYDNFGTGAPGFNRFRGITFPAIAVDRTPGPNRGRVYVAWNECMNWYKDFYTQYPPARVIDCEVNERTEPNDFFIGPRGPTPFTPGQILCGSFNSSSDVDLYSFAATQGHTYSFWCDSIPFSYYSMRVICADTVTRINLAGSGEAPGVNGFITWTCPKSGTYCLRMFFVPGSNPNNGTTSVPGFYRVLTVENTVGIEPGRDERDVMVVSSPDGVAFGAPTRPNDDPPYLDDWLPEIAVGGDGFVYAAWYDWRDAPDTTCGGESNIYLARSEDGGGSWTTVGRLTDATTPWTRVHSNIEPNQGDYLGLAADDVALLPVWADGRFGTPDIFASSLPLSTTPTLLSLAGADAEIGRVTLTWYSASSQVDVGYVYRLEGGRWIFKTAISKDGTGRLVYTDTDVHPGVRYTYHLGIRDGGFERFLGEVSVVVPTRTTLTLEDVHPNPTARDVWVAFTLPVDAPATLSLLDISGRRVRVRDVGALGKGRHLLDLSGGSLLPTGVYVVRIEQGGRVETARVSVVR